MRPRPNHMDHDVYDVYLALDGREYFVIRFMGRPAAGRACIKLEAQYRRIGGKARIKTINPQKGGQATGDPSANGHPPR